ncbi:hypothetical protein BJ165DRAFT_1075010 [Panaeolus papilionaceus]|nr:hypothetical protein BJ165DRAFT_1075010 [Panaeolus papilionaceus]
MALLAIELTTTLPLEVIFHNIDIGLYNDSPTLRILSLTCHAIHLYIHRYIFRRVRLWVRDPQRLVASNVPGFLAIIRRSPTILSAIHSLIIVLSIDTSTLHEQRIAEVDALCSVMREELLNPTSLTIHAGALDRVSQIPQFRTSLSQLFRNPNLSKLRVWGYGYLDKSLLDNATHIVNFGIQTVPSGANDSIVNAANRSPPRLRPTTFTLYEPPSNSAALSSAYCDLTAVSTFRIFGIAPPLQAIPAYFGKCSSTLTRLELYVTTYQTYLQPGSSRMLFTQYDGQSAD